MGDPADAIADRAPDEAEIADLLRSAGVAIAPADISIAEREDRLVVMLPDDRMAWFATNGTGVEKLRREAVVLELLAGRCSFSAPRVLAAHATWQLRQAVPGTVDPWTAYARVQRDPLYARAVGAQLGAMLAEQHMNIGAAELAGVVSEWPSWPPRRPDLERDLPQVVDDPDLLRRALDVIGQHERAEAAATERVLTHGDLGLHNLAFAADGSVAGIFDYDGAALTDRHHDFAFMLFDTTDDAMLAGAVEAYRAAGGASIDLGRVALLNAAAAIGFLAYRVGSTPLDRPAGRTLDQDLAWTRLAIGRLLK